MEETQPAHTADTPHRLDLVLHHLSKSVRWGTGDDEKQLGVGGGGGGGGHRRGVYLQPDLDQSDQVAGKQLR